MWERRKMASEMSKKRKLNPPPRRLLSSFTSSKEATHQSNKNLAVATAQASSHVTIQQAKNFAVAEAQAEHCTGNFRIFDSPFGNFLLPVIPTRAELADK